MQGFKAWQLLHIALRGTICWFLLYLLSYFSALMSCRCKSQSLIEVMSHASWILHFRVSPKSKPVKELLYATAGCCNILSLSKVISSAI